MKKIITFIFVLSAFHLNAQISNDDLPYFFVKNVKTTGLPVFQVENFNPEKLLREDNENKFLKPYRFAKGFDVDLNFEKNIFNDNQLKISYLMIVVPNAKSIAVRFDDFELSGDEKVFIFDNHKEFLAGAFTEMNNKTSGNLSTVFIPTDTLIIEYQHYEGHNVLKIDNIAVGYRKMSSDWCEININCDDDERWQTVKKAVAKYSFQDDDDGDYYVCTGTLVANTKLDETPYFLTANHCVNTESEANSMVLYFNYEATLCGGTTGSTSQTISGASFVATANGHLDFTLLELSEVPPETYEPYYAGWDRLQSYSDTSVCIHHPSGDIKKISKNYSALEVESFGSEYDANKHWKIAEWDEGTTEGGSSGSGLFTTSGRLIGTLTGGEASCDYNYNDYFQQFYHSWDDYNDVNQQLKAWLDPFGFNPEFMDGYFPYKNTELPVPENFSAEFENDSVVKITWDESSPTPDRYTVYKNLQPIVDTAENVVIYDTLRETNVYVYFATAKYGGEESKPSEMVSLVFGDTSSVPKITEIKIYPVPFDDYLVIQTPDTIPVTKVEFYSLDGKCAYSEQVDNLNYISVDTRKLQNSFYFVKIYTTGEMYIRRLMKITK